MTRYHAAAVIGRKHGGKLRRAGEIYRLCPNLLEVGGEFEYYRGLSCLLNALDAGEAAVLIGVDAYAENVAVRCDREAVEAAVIGAADSESVNDVAVAVELKDECEGLVV